MPGHTNAALASYAELNCDGVAPPLYTGTDVGFSSLCVGKEITYTFLDDVLRELAALTPGPYLHIGGDEAHSTPARGLPHVHRPSAADGRRARQAVMGWQEIAETPLPATAPSRSTGVPTTTRAAELAAGGRARAPRW